MCLNTFNQEKSGSRKFLSIAQSQKSDVEVSLDRTITGKYK
ncbi:MULTISPECIES: hypothetical protein [Arthrospira]|nr:MULTISPECIES: hypothetical protein [Arthrospira]MDF2207615.1 hypothetical protein [Arthrospira platensis NCB002]MDT9183243.1 hypothetical protein [Limnospira sp. PMC 289.06]MDT9295303.1 hypothetical protein [Arthrospira platensis PCC 7345]WAK73933.1 hypothetical protein AP9108_36080 [Arthrospira sp. PCC 9108]